jgi:hypothetical protein|tara:strand:+ start:170 stop:577 length:408 start_codon:yes stop_codon:yes gene_type:complete
MAKLCPRGKAAAKRKFKVYPSAYANMYASAVCSGKVTPGGKKKRKKAMGGGMMNERIGLKTGLLVEDSPKTKALKKLNEKKKIDSEVFKPDSFKEFKRKNKAGGGLMNERIGLKAGSKGCKLAMKGKGRAYGKNS